MQNKTTDTIFRLFRKIIHHMTELIKKELETACENKLGVNLGDGSFVCVEIFSEIHGENIIPIGDNKVVCVFFWDFSYEMRSGVAGSTAINKEYGKLNTYSGSSTIDYTTKKIQTNFTGKNGGKGTTRIINLFAKLFNALASGAPAQSV